MKAISLWQPWASAIAAGSKTIETRHWFTKHRGPLAIHAAKRQVREELDYYWNSFFWRGALSPLVHVGTKHGWLDLPFGAIVAVVDLVECRPTESFGSEIDKTRTAANLMPLSANRFAWTERQMGDFSPDRFGWVFRNIRRLETPLTCTGRQMIFNVPDITNEIELVSV